MQDRDFKKIKAAINNIEKKMLTQYLQAELAEAKKLISSLEKIERLRKAVLSMDRATMSEIRRYNQPPEAVHEVMVACLLLLGDHEGNTRVSKVY